jgi:hypothetical protein
MQVRLSNHRTIQTISPSGEVVAKPRILRNIALDVLWPQEPVVIVDWLSQGRARPSWEDLSAPIKFQGLTYRGDWAWGSSVKVGKTFGFTRDLLVECGLLQYAERGIKTGRMLLNQGMYGGLRGTFNVLVAKPGSMFKDYPLADGHSLIGKSLAEKGYEPEMDEICLRSGKLSGSIFQFFPWQEIGEEAEPALRDFLLRIKAGDWTQRDDGENRPELSEERRQLALLDRAMNLHPYIAGQLANASADFFMRSATTIPMPVQVRIAVPTTAPVCTLRGKQLLVRYPANSTAAIQAIRCNPTKAEEARIARLEVLQYTIASPKLMGNGCFGVVEDSVLPKGIDVVLCRDDIKMGSRALGKRVVQGAIMFNQQFAKGTAVGLNPVFGKTMGADFDGDLLFGILCKEFPRMWEVARNFPNGASAAKIKNPPSPLEDRARMIANSMSNLIGWGTNVLASSYLIADREKLAAEIGFKSVESMDKSLSFFVKCGEDGFKTMIDLEAIEKQLGNLQKKIQRVTIRMAPWSRWRRDIWAFRRGVPEFYRKGLPKYIDRVAPLEWWDGTIAEICKVSLPYLKDVVGEPIKMKPLSSYRAWAKPVRKDQLDSVRELHEVFVARVQSINFGDPQEWKYFRLWWQKLVRKWQTDNALDDETACAALWRVAHTTRSLAASGASVFMAFPEEVKRIIAEKPGMNVKSLKMLVLGLNHAFSPPPISLDCQVTIRQWEQRRNGKATMRSVLLASVGGQIETRPPYPKGMIGLIQNESDHPPEGIYMASLIKAGKGMAWHCKLTAVS